MMWKYRLWLLILAGFVFSCQSRTSVLEQKNTPQVQFCDIQTQQEKVIVELQLQEPLLKNVVIHAVYWNGQYHHLTSKDGLRFQKNEKKSDLNLNTSPEKEFGNEIPPVFNEIFDVPLSKYKLVYSVGKKIKYLELPMQPKKPLK